MEGLIADNDMKAKNFIFNQSYQAASGGSKNFLGCVVHAKQFKIYYEK